MGKKHEIWPRSRVWLDIKNKFPTKMMQDANMHKVVSFAKISLFFACIEALLLKRATTRNALADATAFQKFEVREAESIRQPLPGISP